jgi:hypothetical protein
MNMWPAIAAERVVRHLERAGFGVMRRPPIGGGAALGRGAAQLGQGDLRGESGFAPPIL